MTESFRLASARTEDLDAATRASIVRLCIQAHEEPDFENLFNYVPAGGWHFLGHSAEELVSHALVTTRWLQVGNQPLLRTAYIDAVATLPACQGQGHGSALMAYLADEIAQTYTIACLETERPGFYERLGWETWQGPLAGRGEHGLIPTPGQTGIMILRLPGTPALDLSALLTIESQGVRIW